VRALEADHRRQDRHLRLRPPDGRPAPPRSSARRVRCIEADRRPGDLLKVNGGIFKPQGQAIAKNAAPDVKILVVGNPCNTNCLIARSNAPEIPGDRWFAMTRLDQNRAKSQLAKRAKASVADVKSLAIWGNHSATQFPDFANATIGGRRVTDEIDDISWLQGDFITTVQKRGAAIIEARGVSSAASAASAAIDTVVGLTLRTPDDDVVSVAVTSNGEYNVPDGLTFGFPVIANGDNDWSVKQGFEIDAFAQDRIKVTTDELISERDEVRTLGLIP
jgi:malate dehydrogenase